MAEPAPDRRRAHRPVARSRCCPLLGARGPRRHADRRPRSTPSSPGSSPTSGPRSWRASLELPPRPARRARGRGRPVDRRRLGGAPRPADRRHRPAVRAGRSVVVRRDVPGGFAPAAEVLGARAAVGRRAARSSSPRSRRCRCGPTRSTTSSSRSAGSPLVLHALAPRGPGARRSRPARLARGPGRRRGRRAHAAARASCSATPRSSAAASTRASGRTCSPTTGSGRRRLARASSSGSSHFDGGGGARFRQAVVRDAAYSALPVPPAPRAAPPGRGGHRAARRRARSTRVADQLALHFAEGGDAERAWRFAGVAADTARAAYANDDAAALYRRALDAGRRLDGVDQADVVATWTALGDVLEQAGRPDEALDAYRRATPLVGGDRVAAGRAASSSGRGSASAPARSSPRSASVADRRAAPGRRDGATRRRTGPGPRPRRSARGHPRGAGAAPAGAARPPSRPPTRADGARRAARARPRPERHRLGAPGAGRARPRRPPAAGRRDLRVARSSPTGRPPPSATRARCTTGSGAGTTPSSATGEPTTPTCRPATSSTPPPSRATSPSCCSTAASSAARPRRSLEAAAHPSRGRLRRRGPLRRDPARPPARTARATTEAAARLLDAVVEEVISARAPRHGPGSGRPPGRLPCCDR